jgi:hypothetical protein
MLSWVTRLFVLRPAIKELRERVDQLESDVEFLAGDLKKLRGKVTGGLRRNNQPEEPVEPPQRHDEEEAILSRIDPRFRGLWRAKLAQMRASPGGNGK